MLDAGHVMFIEWGDAIQALLPESALEVEITIENDSGRRIEITAPAESWALRWERLEQIAQPWKVA